MRDPFILVQTVYLSREDKRVCENGKVSINHTNTTDGNERKLVYWLYGTTDKPPSNVNPYSKYPATGFQCYCSHDLVSWFGPYDAFRRDPECPFDTQFWAPEVYGRFFGVDCDETVYGKYVMLATMNKSVGDCHRGVYALCSDSPSGPFHFVSKRYEPLTPSSWSCLDGSLYVDEYGVFYMVFCREWTQVKNGQVCVVKVKKDFSGPIDEPTVLFFGSEASWVKNNSKSSNSKSEYALDQNQPCTITDGPFIYKSKVSGELLILWSSFYSETDLYCVGVARSQGSIYGPWRQDVEPLFIGDGGHPMIVHDPDSDCLVLSLHVHNKHVNMSHPRLFIIKEELDESTNQCNLKIVARKS